MKDTFNTNFYLASATVIPLLYISLFLQGQMVQNLSLRPVRAFRKLASLLDHYSRTQNVIIFFVLLAPANFLFGAVLAAVIIAILVVVFVGLIAEGLSLVALYYQSDSVLTREFILWSMVGLLILIGLGPAATITRILIGRESSDTSDEKPDSAKGGEQEVHSKTGGETPNSSTELGWPPSD